MPAPSEFDVVNFFKQSEAVKSGLLPYTDFVFEFPPFALLFFLIPGVFTSDQNTYALLFGIMVIASVMITAVFMQRICKMMGMNRLIATIVFILMILICFPVRKYDAFPMCIVAVALYFFIKRRFGLAYGLAAFATLTKIYPGLIIILFLAINITERDDARLKNVMVGIASCIIVAALAFVPLLMAGVPLHDALSFMSFHSGRGFQNESLFAVLVSTLTMLGITDSHIEFEHDAYNIVGPLTDAVMPYWMIVTAATVLIVLLIMIRFVSKRKDHEYGGWNARILVLMSMTVILAFLLVNKVFSTQYLLWLMPMLACVPLTFKRYRGYAIISVMMIVGLSTAYLMCESNSAPFLVLNILRDAILILLFAICIHSMIFPDSSNNLLDFEQD